MSRATTLALVAAFVALTSLPVSAYYHFVYYLSSGNAPAKFDLTALPNNTVWFFVSETGPTSYSANDNFSSVVGQIRQATQVWNAVSSSALRVGFGGFENANTSQNTPAADVVFDDLAPGLLGFGGPTILSTAVTPAGGSLATDVRAVKSAVAATPFVPIARSAIHLNQNGLVAPYPSYSESFFMVLVHEMGHALGLQHTFTSATMSTATTSATSVANPLDADDIAGLSVLYPNSAFAQTGSISGQITSGGSGVHLESVVAIREGVGAVSALTNPDGTFEIDGVPPGDYFVYAHSLPPDAAIAGPWNSDGSIAAPSGATTALFYPGTANVELATPVTVTAGGIAGGIDIGLTNLSTLPIYDVAVYGYFNNNTVAIKPAYLNIQAGEAAVAASGIGLGANGQAPGLNARFMGSSAVIPGAGVQPYQSGGNTYIALYVIYSPFSSVGEQHLIVTTPGFMHVLPAAVRLTQQSPPTIQSVSANADGSLTVTGTNWTNGSAIYFDGLPASISSLNVTTNSTPDTAIVTAPPGTSRQTAVLTVYNPDGQNSQFVQPTYPVSYTYGSGPAQTIASVSPASLPAGAEATVDITGTGFNFVTGQTAVGFGTSDIAVQQVFVLGPNHLQVDVSVAANAVLSSPDISVFSGFQMATRTAAFHITASVTGLPAPIPVLTNVLPGLNGAYASATVSLYGSNLTAAGATPSISIGGLAAQILFGSPTQINLQIPAGLASGPTQLQLNNSVLSAYPITVNIDTQPAVITGIQDGGGHTITSAYPTLQGDLLLVDLSGFAPDGTVIAPAQVQVGVGGVLHNVLVVTQPGSGVFQVSFLLNPNETTGSAQNLIVYFNGRSSYSATIPVSPLKPGN